MVTVSEIIQSTTLRNNLSDVLKSVERKKPGWLLVTGKNKARAALVNLDLFEDMLGCSSPTYLKSIKNAREQVKQNKLLTHQEVFGELE